MYRRETVHSDLQGTNGTMRGDASKLREFCEQLANKHRLDQIVFLCIGTDRSTGDALGPLVGSALAEKGCPHVVGTLESPCDSNNLKLRLQNVPADKVLIAIDACLGHPLNVGQYLIAEGSIQPAESVGTELPAVGDYSIAAIVNENGVKPYWTLQTTSLYFVMRMAREIVESITSAFHKDGCNPKS